MTWRIIVLCACERGKSLGRGFIVFPGTLTNVIGHFSQNRQKKKKKVKISRVIAETRFDRNVNIYGVQMRALANDGLRGPKWSIQDARNRSSKFENLSFSRPDRVLFSLLLSFISFLVPQTGFPDGDPFVAPVFRIRFKPKYVVMDFFFRSIQ